MRTSRLLALLVLSALLPVPLRAADAPETGQHAQEMKRQVPIEQRYLLFLPADYGKEKDKKWPLILFLHGSGERGTDIEIVKKHGPPKIVENKKDFPFIVVSPQCDPNKWWDPFTLAGLLDEVGEKYSVDADRVYLTGLSMGGFGTWDLASKYPNRFAAIAPICGGSDSVRRVARSLKEMPTWVFHGEKDQSVPFQQSVTLVDALKQAGNTDVQFTSYPDLGHDCWTVTYDNPKLYDWFLSHKRGERPAPSSPQK
jgi:predicted peptidase